jgi:hypothetical protein
MASGCPDCLVSATSLFTNQGTCQVCGMTLKVGPHYLHRQDNVALAANVFTDDDAVVDGLARYGLSDPNPFQGSGFGLWNLCCLREKRVVKLLYALRFRVKSLLATDIPSLALLFPNDDDSRNGDDSLNDDDEDLTDPCASNPHLWTGWMEQGRLLNPSGFSNGQIALLALLQDVESYANFFSHV